MATLKSLVRCTAATALALGMSFGVVTSVAQAATLKMSATLQIEKYRYDNSGRYQVTVQAHIPMPRAEAQRYVNEGPRATLRLFGDDPSNDNLQGGPYFFGAGTQNGPGSIFVTPNADSLTVLSQILVEPRVLNEDNGWYEGAGDEIYARLRFVAGNGQEITDDSNVVSGEF